MKRVAILLAGILAVAGCHRNTAQQGPAPVRVAVIGGMAMSGMWQAVSAEFTKETGIPVVVAAVGPKEILDAEFRKGGIDLVTLHSSDTATNFVADGLGINMHPWARNELVIVGPPRDPAKIFGMKSGMEALLKIARAQAPFVEARNTGSQTIEIKLWRKAGFAPKGAWLIKDESPTPQQVVEFAAQRGAYVIVGRLPILYGKMPSAGMEIMVEGDPEMQRPYVVIEANPARKLGKNPEGAHELAEFLTSPAGQNALETFAARENKGLPVFYPVTATTNHEN
jgi:tungstate transport system substrate-binding protein